MRTCVRLARLATPRRGRGSDAGPFALIVAVKTHPNFVVATPGRSVCDDNARALHRHGLLRFLALGTRRGTAGIPRERTRLNPRIGLCAYIAFRTLSSFRAETFRFGLLPWFDSWVKKQLEPGDNIISSYGNTNRCFEWVRANGGKTFLEAGNSHPENYWSVLKEEYARWGCSLPPMPRNWYKRSIAMLPHVDYVLSPSSYVTNSFLQRGFKSAQILQNIFPIDLNHFYPSPEPRPRSRPLTIISTGSPSLRKGTPYLLEAFRLVRKQNPSARLLLTSIPHESLVPLLSRYRDLPIEWIPWRSHSQLGDELRSADIFVLPSLEEGLARTSLEALACGLPIIVTSHTGSNDFVTPDANGEIIPIRDAGSIAEAILKWADKLLSLSWQPKSLLDTERFLFSHFEQVFMQQLERIRLTS